jgi:hypothetical protein
VYLKYHEASSGFGGLTARPQGAVTEPLGIAAAFASAMMRCASAARMGSSHCRLQRGRTVGGSGDLAEAGRLRSLRCHPAVKGRPFCALGALPHQCGSANAQAPTRRRLRLQKKLA